MIVATRNPIKQTLVEWVARAIFTREQTSLLGHRPSQGWIDSGWENCSDMANAAIKAVEEWKLANVRRV